MTYKVATTFNHIWGLLININYEYLAYFIPLFLLSYFLLIKLKRITLDKINANYKNYEFINIIIILITSYIISTYAANNLLKVIGKIDDDSLKGTVISYLDKSTNGNAWDIMIITPKKLPLSLEKEMIVLFKIKNIDHRYYFKVKYLGSSYKIKLIKSESGISRYIALPRRSSTHWIDVKERNFPFNGIHNLSLICNFIDKNGQKGELILDNSHIDHIEPLYMGTYYIKIYLTSVGRRRLNRFAKIGKGNKLGVKIGFHKYTAQHLSPGHDYQHILIPTNYNLIQTKYIIKELLNHRDEMHFH